MGFRLGEDRLTLKVVEDFIKGGIQVEISRKRRRRLEQVRRFVEARIDNEHAYYGINTGFGKLSNTKIDPADLEILQKNLIRSHAFGVGDELGKDAVRLMMLLRAHVIAMGYSGASLEVIDLLAEMINRGVIPIVPSQGSVGASGDLAPLAFLGLAMIGEGEAVYNDEISPAADALGRAGLKPVRLRAKDGLSLINGTQAMTSLGALALLKAGNLIRVMDIAAALTVEGFKGSSAPFDRDVSEVRAQKGQENAAAMMRMLLGGSEIISSHVHCTRVQDPYSLRCIPQVHGAVRDAFYYAGDIISRELNSCTDNPLVFVDEEKIVSGGNFHGETLAMAMDTLAIAVAELGSISERRIQQLTDPEAGDIPVLFLTPKPGLNSGFMVPHIVASSLASENKTLAHPASVDSIPTSADYEDHVSMGMWSARKLLKIIENVEWIGVIEAMAACQAIDLHNDGLKPGAGTRAAYDEVRRSVGFIDADRYMMPEAKSLHEAIVAGRVAGVVEEVVGEWII